MYNLMLKEGTKYAVDLKGVSVINTKERVSVFINYPEAATWLVLMRNYRSKKTTLKMLEAILSKEGDELIAHLDRCIISWKKSGLIE